MNVNSDKMKEKRIKCKHNLKLVSKYDELVLELWYLQCAGIEKHGFFSRFSREKQRGN